MSKVSITNDTSLDADVSSNSLTGSEVVNRTLTVVSRLVSCNLGVIDGSRLGLLDCWKGTNQLGGLDGSLPKYPCLPPVNTLESLVSR